MTTASLSAQAAPMAQATQATLLPVLRKDIQITEGQRTRDGTPSWLIHDPVRNRFVNIGWLEYEMIKRWPLRNPARIADTILDQTTLDIVTEDVTGFCDFLRENDLVQIISADDRQQLAGRKQQKIEAMEKKGLQRRIFFRVPLLRPDKFLSATLAVPRLLVSQPALWILAMVAVVGFFLIIRQWDTFAQTFTSVMRWQSAPWMLVALGVVKCFHELGHAWAARHYGLSVPTMGIAFFVVWPFLYTDTTDAWRLRNRRQRITIGSAGMAAELYIAIVCTCLWSFLADGVLRNTAFFIGTASWVMTLIVNANPFMRWDGYYILSDAIQIENLHGRSFALGRWKLRELIFGFGEPAPEQHARPMRRFLIIYAWGTWIYRVFLFAGLAWMAYSFLFKALGIIAMLLAVTWFIAGPMLAELKEWRARRHLMKPNINTFISLCLLSALVFGILYPWQRHVTAPAIAQSPSYTPIYAPISGRLVDINAREGQTTSKGDRLFTINSDELEFEKRIAAVKERRYESALARQSEEDFLEQREVLNEKLTEARTKMNGLSERSEALTIKAPFDGEITRLANVVKPGQWISDSVPLAVLVNRSEFEVTAYVDEVELGRVRDDATAVFFPEDPAIEAVSLEMVETATTRVQRLPDRSLASSFGGPVDVRDDGSLEPVRSLYPVRFRAQGDVPAILLQATARGTVHLEAESISTLSASVRHVSGVLRRESGF